MKVRVSNDLGSVEVTAAPSMVKVVPGFPPTAPTTIPFDPFSTTPPPGGAVTTWEFINFVLSNAKSLGLWY